MLAACRRLSWQPSSFEHMLHTVYSGSVRNFHLGATVKPFNFGCPKSWRLCMQNYFGPFNFGELKPYNSNVVIAVDIRALNFAVLFGSRNSRNKGHANIKSFTEPRTSEGRKSPKSQKTKPFHFLATSLHMSRSEAPVGCLGDEVPQKLKQFADIRLQILTA